ncbi:MAG: hypothetical protein JWQ42_1706 [Edaphobacter sp.]|nr:hypothetical protein [Edaphobacter sp.]
MHTRQGVAEPALSQHSRDDYEQDAQRRAARHQQFWSEEPLTPRQEFILCRELDCGRRYPDVQPMETREPGL